MKKGSEQTIVNGKEHRKQETLCISTCDYAKFIQNVEKGNIEHVITSITK